MQRVELRKLAASKEEYADKQLTVAGWVRTIRTSKNLGFIELNDGTCFQNLQVVFENSKVENFNEISKLNVGASIVVKGQLILTPEAKQPYEVHADEIAIEGLSTPDYPLQKKRHSVEFLRTIAHLRPRTNTFSAVFRVRSIAAFAIHKFFNERGFVYAHTPLITGSDCEGSTTCRTPGTWARSSGWPTGSASRTSSAPKPRPTVSTPRSYKPRWGRSSAYGSTTPTSRRCFRRPPRWDFRSAEPFWKERTSTKPN